MTWFNGRILTVFLGLSLFLMQASLVFPQGAKKSSSQTKPTAWLSKPMEWGSFTARLFADEKKVTFQLVTSWIPAEKHQGMMRYRMSAYPDRSEETETTDATDGKTTSNDEKLLRLVHECIITLNLYDVDGFVLRKIEVPLMQGVDDNAKLTSLHANTAVQMDAAEYRSLLGTPKASGSWNVSWACPLYKP
jgi:hypothetical protein